MEAILQRERNAWASFVARDMDAQFSGVSPAQLQNYAVSMPGDLYYDFPVPDSLPHHLVDQMTLSDKPLQCSAEYFDAFFVSVLVKVPPDGVHLYLLPQEDGESIHMACLSARGVCLSRCVQLSKALVQEFKSICCQSVVRASRRERISGELAEAIFVPLNDTLIHFSWVVVIAAGHMADVALHALPWGSELLAARMVVSYADSVLTMLMQEPHGREVLPDGKKPYAFIYSGPTDSMDSAGKPLAYLRYASCEGKVVADVLKEQMHVFALEGSEVIYDSVAGLANLVDWHDIERPREVLHMACHFDFQGAGDHVKSCLCFSDSENVSLPILKDVLPGICPKLIFLSACSTGEPGSFADAYNLTLSAILPYRPKYVITTHWPVSDASALVFSKIFYDRYIQTRDPVQALQLTQKAMSAMTLDEMKAAATTLVLKFPCESRHADFVCQNTPGWSFRRSPQNSDAISNDAVANELLAAIEHLNLEANEADTPVSPPAKSARKLLCTGPDSCKKLYRLSPHHWAAYRLYCNPSSPSEEGGFGTFKEIPLNPFLPSPCRTYKGPDNIALRLFKQDDKVGVLLGGQMSLHGSNLQWLDGNGAPTVKLQSSASCVALTREGCILVAASTPMPITCFDAEHHLKWSTQLVSECLSLSLTYDETIVFAICREAAMVTKLMAVHVSDGSVALRFNNIMSNWPSDGACCKCLHIPPSAQDQRDLLAVLDTFQPSVELHDLEHGGCLHDFELNDLHCRDMCLWSCNEILISGIFYIKRVNTTGEVLQVLCTLIDCHLITCTTTAVYAVGSAGRRVYRWARTEFLNSVFDKDLGCRVHATRFETPRGYPLDTALRFEYTKFEDDADLLDSRANTFSYKFEFNPEAGDRLRSLLTGNVSEGGLALKEAPVERGCFEIRAGSFSSGEIVIRFSLNEIQDVDYALRSQGCFTWTVVPDEQDGASEEEDEQQ